MATTVEQHERALHQPAFCELLPVRDIMNDVIIRTTGVLVAGYELSGINSYYHNDEGRNRSKRPSRRWSAPCRNARCGCRSGSRSPRGWAVSWRSTRANCGIKIPRCWHSTGSGSNAGEARSGPGSTCGRPCMRASTGIPRCITNRRATAWRRPPSASGSRRRSASSARGASMRTIWRNSPRCFRAWSSGGDTVRCPQGTANHVPDWDLGLAPLQHREAEERPAARDGDELRCHTQTSERPRPPRIPASSRWRRRLPRR